MKRAKEFYLDIVLKEKLNTAIHPTTFLAVAKQFLHLQEAEVESGDLGARTQKEDIKKLTNDILPFFQDRDIATITTATLKEYHAILRRRNLSKSTRNKHFCVIRKVLVLAVENETIKTLPAFPSIGVDCNPRPYFTSKAYAKLWYMALMYAHRKNVSDYKLKDYPPRKLKYTVEFSDFISFSANVFVRLSDVIMLQHKHVQAITGPANYLEIFPPHSKTAKKTVNRSSCSMPQAFHVYQELLHRHRSLGFGKPDDFVFYPEHKNRRYALEVIGRLFRNLLNETGLRDQEGGARWTLYSLRHTALMNRFLDGDNVDIFLLAKNALTSVEMLEKFYLSHAASKMKIAELQAFKDPNKAAFFDKYYSASTPLSFCQLLDETPKRERHET